MLIDPKLRVLSDMFPPSKDLATGNDSDYVLRLKKGIRRLILSDDTYRYLIVDRRKAATSTVDHEDDLVRIYGPIFPPKTHRKFHHPWSKNSSHVVRFLAPTNHLFQNAQLCTQPMTVHHNKIRPYKGALPVSFEDEAYTIAERKPPNGIIKANQRE